VDFQGIPASVAAARPGAVAIRFEIAGAVINAKAIAQKIKTRVIGLPSRFATINISELTVWRCGVGHKPAAGGSA
jgi:hypothetical protein